MNDMHDMLDDEDDEQFSIEEARIDAEEEARNAKRLFTVDEKNKYMFEVHEIKSIEDAGDTFYTYAEIKEMIGSDDGYFYLRTTNFREKMIREALAAYTSQLDDKKKSIVINDPELVEVLRDFSRPLKYWTEAEGFRRVNDRLTKYTVAEKKVAPTKRLADKLISIAKTAVNKTIKFEFNLTYYANDRENAIKLLKKLTTWNDIVAVREENEWIKSQVTDEHLKILKQIWDKPELFPAAAEPDDE